LCGIVESEDGVTQRGCQIGTTLSALDNDLGDVTEGLHHVFRLTHMDEAYRGCDDAGRTSLALAYQVAEFHQCCGGITKGKKRIGMLLYGQTDASLRAGDAL